MRPEHLSNLDLNLLMVADALLETHSVTETSHIVHLSQPAVSRALGRLRDQLGDPLLVRERRAMVLTPFAEQLRPRLRKALLQLERTLVDRDRFDPGAARGALKMATADYASVVFVPAAVRRLAAQAPSVSLVTLPYAEPFEQLLESEECDLVVGHRPSEKSWVASEVLFSSGWSCVGRRGNPWFEAPSLQAYTAAEHLLVSPTGQGLGPVDAVLQQLRQRRMIRARVPDFSGALAIAAQTDLLLAVPDLLAVGAARILPLTVSPLPFAIPRSEVFMSWHRAREDQRLSWARDLVLSLVRDEA